MSVTPQLSYEARVRPRQAGIAALGALLFVAAAAAQLSGPQVSVTELTAQLISINKRFPLDLVGSALEAAGLIALIWSLSFLLSAARARKPELNSAVRIVVLIGGGVAAVGGIVYAAVIAVKAHQFVLHGAQTYQQAHQLTRGAALPTLQTLEIAAQFALSVGLVLVALNALRVGLLTRFMGYFGILVGAASLLLIGSPPAVALQICWLLALAYLFSGRWPNGDPPSWRTGRAEPWPSSVEMREQRMKAAGGSKPTRAAEADSAPLQTSARTRSTTPKRKRKRRK